METLCLSSQPLDDIDVATIDCMSSRDWRAAQLRDPIIGHFVRSLNNGARPTRNKVPIFNESNTLFRDLDHLSCDKGVLYRKTKINGEERKQLALPIEYRTTALRGLHNETGHQGRDRTLSLLQERFYFPGMSKMVDNWIKGCGRCVRRKTNINARAPLVNITTVNRWNWCALII